MTPADAHHRADIAIGGVTVGVRTSSEDFLHLLEERYAGFMESGRAPDYEFDVDLTVPENTDPEDDVNVYRSGSLWRLERGDFRAEWDPDSRKGRIRQSPNPYSIDTVLRIVHTLVLAREGGFLMHAASAVRNGKAFLFAGVSGAGKTTISRLAPPDAQLLTDEVSYIRKEAGSYFAYGTPFAGELARAGENIRAPLETVFLLEQGPQNVVEPVSAAAAARAILGNMLFFAQDAELVQAVFLSALDLVEHVPVRKLTFMPDARIWEMIR